MTDIQSAVGDNGLASDLAAGCRRGVLLAAALLTLVLRPTVPAGSEPQPLAHSLPAAVVQSNSTRLPFAGFDVETANVSAHVRELAHWIASTGNNQGQNFVLVDKQDAKLYVFDANAIVRGATAVLVGAALGDDSAPGIGTRPIADVRFEERTTPAGRFIGQPGRNTLGEDVVWVDYAAAVSMHRVRLTTPSERRQERLSSATPTDNRISYGCINVPPSFYDAHIKPMFDASRRGVIYVLPDVKSIDEVFGTSGRAGPQG